MLTAVIAAGYEGGLAVWGAGSWTRAKRWKEPRVAVSGSLDLEGVARLVRGYSQVTAAAPAEIRARGETSAQRFRRMHAGVRPMSCISSCLPSNGALRLRSTLPCG